LSGEVVFSGDGFIARPAQREETAEIQAFSEANAGYWWLTHGHGPPPDDAEQAFDWLPPEDMSFSSNHWFIVRDARTQAIAAQVYCTADLMARGVCHLAFFLVETRRLGSGFAQELHAAYERWAIEQGARWLRLCVVEVNERAYRFWRSRGYVEVSREENFQLGALRHTLIKMAKPLRQESLATYLAAVPRDRPVGFDE